MSAFLEQREALISVSDQLVYRKKKNLPLWEDAMEKIEYEWLLR